MTRLGNLSPEGSIAIGVIVCLLSSGIQSLGLTLQRKSHMLEEKEYFDNPRPAYKRRRWQVGFSLFLVANLVGSTIQLSILPLPVLAALQAAGLVFNSINATWILGESFTRWSLLGTVLVSGGALLIAYYGSLSEPAHSLQQLLALFARKEFIIWAVAQGLLIFSTFGMIYLLRRFTPSHGRSKRMRLARGMCYGALSGMLSAHSLLMAKSAVELLVRTVADGENQFARWQAWVILLALVAIGLSQLYCLHSGLQLCSTSVLYPFVFCVYNVITILDGLIYFDQGSQLSDLATGLIVLGTLILLSGVFCLSWRLADHDDDDDDDDDDPHEQETSESLLTPPVGVVGTPLSPNSARRRDETDPLLSKSPGRNSMNSPFSFRPERAHDWSNTNDADDEEASVGFDPSSSLRQDVGHEDESALIVKLAKTRKRATFADFGTMAYETGQRRVSTNMSPESRRRSSVISPYARNRSRRMSVADSRALWGELEEADNSFGRDDAMSRSDTFGLSSRRLESSGGRRRMSEGSSQLLSRSRPTSGGTSRMRRSSDAAR